MSSASPQGGALLIMPQDHQGSLSASLSVIAGLKDTYDPDKDSKSGFLASWVDASVGPSGTWTATCIDPSPAHHCSLCLHLLLQVPNSSTRHASHALHGP
ncbi:hypothetical protein HispidOSU_028068 [Sigmodon hispidus]